MWEKTFYHWPVVLLVQDVDGFRLLNSAFSDALHTSCRMLTSISSLRPLAGKLVRDSANILEWVQENQVQ